MKSKPNAVRLLAIGAVAGSLLWAGSPSARADNNPIRPVAPSPSGLPTITLTSTTKLEQLNGQWDNQLKQPTLSQTETRFGVIGADLGNSFDNGRTTFLLFGDTVGVIGKALDGIGVIDAADPERGVVLGYVPNGVKGEYETITPPGIKMGAFDVPVAGITLDGQMYIAIKTDHSPDKNNPTDRSVLLHYIPNAILLNPSTFKPLGQISQLPGGHFIGMSLHEASPGMPGLPPGGPYIVMFGSGWYQHSDAYLALVPKANFIKGDFATGRGAIYWAPSKGPQPWSPNQSDAEPIVTDGTIAQISVTWSKDLKLWLMTFASDAYGSDTAIMFTYAATPWGPWAPARPIFHLSDGLGKFIHQKNVADGLDGPVIGQAKKDQLAAGGHIYAPYVVERWTKATGSTLDIYYLMSTWNPYVTMLMKSEFNVRTALAPAPPPPHILPIPRCAPRAKCPKAQ